MARYVIGDIHGRIDALERLVEKADIAASDEVWLVGDLVNTGPNSREVVRWAAERSNLRCLLGNHDLHMLAVVEDKRAIRKKDTFQDLLDAPDADELIGWLRQQNMVWREDDFMMIHAGLLPEWTPEQAEELGAEIEEKLRGEATKRRSFFETMYGNKPRKWSDELEGQERRRITVNALTRCRVLTEDGKLQFSFKGEYQDIPDGHVAWWELFDRKGCTLLFGHWSALGFRMMDGVIALDSGCAWERELTTVRLDDMNVFQVPAGES